MHGPHYTVTPVCSRQCFPPAMYIHVLASHAQPRTDTIYSSELHACYKLITLPPPPVHFKLFLLSHTQKYTRELHGKLIVEQTGIILVSSHGLPVLLCRHCGGHARGTRQSVPEAQESNGDNTHYAPSCNINAPWLKWRATVTCNYYMGTTGYIATESWLQYA